MIGKIAVFNRDRGFGFVHYNQENAPLGRIFFHIKQWLSRCEPEAGQIVSFEAAIGPKGDYAFNVKVVDPVADGVTDALGEKVGGGAQ